LTKKEHSLNLDYGSISEELSTKNITNPGIKDVFEVVQQIRQAKLPDPAKIGNCGSFFKNPVLSSDKFEQIKTEHPNIRHFELENGQVKIPAGWMIDQAGFKGYKKGNVGVHKNQALVLINLGQATGKEVIELAVQIQKHIQQQFGIKLQPEVNIFPKREQALLS
jgi:UDP-N-acetylmuramate dehydrogenase